MLDDEGEVLQTIQYQKRKPPQEEEPLDNTSEISVGSDSSIESREEDAMDEYIDFLDNFVVPDGTVEAEDGAVSVPSPSSYGRGRRRLQGRARQELDDEVMELQRATAGSSRER
jgi:hypothetical protein